LNVLADLGYSLLEPQHEDPLEHGHRYGMIKNKNVKVRSLFSITKGPCLESTSDGLDFQQSQSLRLPLQLPRQKRLSPNQ
jgi:hypothetical protein